MDSFHVHLKLSNLKKLGSVFRVIEVCVFFIVVSRVSFQFQSPVGEYVKRFFSVLLSHRFVFVIGNVIVITLFAKSGRDTRPDSYDESKVQRLAATVIEGATFGTEHRTGSNPKCTQDYSRITRQNVEDDKLVKNKEHLTKNKACFKRSYSECLEEEIYVKPRRILRRTVTEGGRGVASGSRCDEVDGGGDGDGMSDEEFRVMVETFIRKQQRSLREE